MHASICCERIEVGLPDYLDGVLPPALRLRFDAHLEGCKECWKEWYRLEHVRIVLRSLPRCGMPERMKREAMREFVGSPPLIQRCVTSL